MSGFLLGSAPITQCDVGREWLGWDWCAAPCHHHFLPRTLQPGSGNGGGMGVGTSRWDPWRPLRTRRVRTARDPQCLEAADWEGGLGRGEGRGLRGKGQPTPASLPHSADSQQSRWRFRGKNSQVTITHTWPLYPHWPQPSVSCVFLHLCPSSWLCRAPLTTALLPHTPHLTTPSALPPRLPAGPGRITPLLLSH